MSENGYGYVYAMDAASGVERWKFKTGDSVSCSPAVSGGLVYVGSDDGYLYALDAATGAERWKFKTDDRVESSAAVSGGLVYFGGDGVMPADWDYKTPLIGYVYAVDAATGVERWRFKTEGEVWSSPAVSDGLVYVGSDEGYLYALDAVSGGERWSFKTGGGVRSSPAVSGGLVYVGSDDGYLYALK